MRSAAMQVPRVLPRSFFQRPDAGDECQGPGLRRRGGCAGQVLGIFTDGDLRRRIEAGADLRTATAAQVMHATPRRIAPDALAVNAAEMMETHGITSVLVVDARRHDAGRRGPYPRPDAGQGDLMSAITPSFPAADSSPALSFDPVLLLQAQGVRVAFFDVDGVLTDGGLYVQ
jgi:CBS domain-containing protein